jgi:hypothetical protein
MSVQQPAPMTVEELRKILEGLMPGGTAGIHYDTYADLFPPGEPDLRARAACEAFARAAHCSILNERDADTVWFVKPAA